MLTDIEKQKIVMLYKRTSFTLTEIANLSNCSITSIVRVVKKAIDDGQIIQRPERPKTPKKNYYKPKEKPRGWYGKSKRKFTEQDEEEIAKDYYELNMPLGALKNKWGNIHPVQLQRIRNRFREKYGIKANAPQLVHKKEKK